MITFVAALLTIVALGDSTTAGTPAHKSPIEAPPNGSGNVESQFAYWLMQAHSDWRVLNRGVNGERSDQIRARFARDAAQEKPAVVVIIAGVNDIYQGRSAQSVRAASSRRSTTPPARPGSRWSRAASSPSTSASADQNARMHAVNDWIRGYASSHGGRVVFCDTRAAVAAPGRPDRLVSSPDDLHPSPEGYRLMAAALEPAIKQAILKAP